MARAEVMGAMVCILIIWILVFWLCVEASERIHSLYWGKGFKLDPKIMLLTSFISLIFNTCNLFFLGMCSGNGHGVVDQIHSVFKPHG